MGRNRKLLAILERSAEVASVHDLPARERAALRSLFGPLAHPPKGCTVKAFVTGSRAYGTPRDDSDIDLVVLITEADIAKLGQVADPLDDAGRIHLSAGEFVDSSLRFGRLNLLCMTDPAKFNAWREGTDELIARAPVTRDEAVRVLEAKEMTALHRVFDEALDF